MISKIVEDELKYLDLGDKRLDVRFKKMLTSFLK
jgi:hypothetical protein